ncbi:MAG TPA: YbhB/YbcL family Raf kinase inhibitor-like protein [Acidimicrobiia bacterium]|nr:YbhB/YbcL family Raf kinase inhibitor-like protein [Acidimicrobiia bacterium]
MRLVALFGLLLLAACGANTSDASHDLARKNIPEQITVTSPLFTNNGSLPRGNTCDGAGTPPEIEWRDLPAKTKSVAVVADDPDAGDKPFVHWIVIGLPPVPGSVPSAAKNVHELDNTGGTRGWTAPCPPAGETHHYRFTVYALRDYVCAGDADDIRVQSCSPPGAPSALNLIAANALTKGTMTGTYRR